MPPALVAVFSVSHSRQTQLALSHPFVDPPTALATMDHNEEQQLELEALEAIFLEDYSLLQESPRVVLLKLFPVPGDDAADENQVGVEAKFTLPAQYPEEAPELVLTPLRGLTQRHCDDLTASTLKEVDNLLGMPMIFQLSEVVKEWLMENNRDHTDESMHALMIKKAQDEARAREEEEARARKAERGEDSDSDDEDKPRVIDGTPVTVESFTAWEKKFVDEMRAIKAEEEEEKQSSQPKANQAAVKPDAELTGRAWFEKQALERAQAAITVPGQEGIAAAALGAQDWGEGDIEEELFLDGAADEDLDDLDDLSSDDEDDEDDDSDDEE